MLGCREGFGEGRCWKEGIFGLSCLHGDEIWGKGPPAEGQSMDPRKAVERVEEKGESDNG